MTKTKKQNPKLDVRTSTIRVLNVDPALAAAIGGNEIVLGAAQYQSCGGCRR